MLRQAGGDRGICNGFGHGDLHCVCVGLLSVLIILMGPNVFGGVEGSRQKSGLKNRREIAHNCSRLLLIDDQRAYPQACKPAGQHQTRWAGANDQDICVHRFSLLTD